ncbi:MAG: bactofilin BacO, partial [Myxococcaceae bacterium]
GSGVVEADIETQNVEIAGRVTGNIHATDKVELKADCRVVGDVKAPRILIADGASFKGNVDMDTKER